MDKLIGKKIDLMLEDLWNETTRITGEVMDVGEGGWLVQADSISVPAALRPLTADKRKNLYYVPTRLILLASVSDD